MSSTRYSGLVPLGLCILLLFHGSLAQMHWQRQQTSRLSGRSDCQFQRITAREPNRRQVSEAGVSEFWDSYEGDELECAGVQVVRHIINPKGLLLPYYPNTPELVYVVRGQGIQGTVLPGCEETFETSFPMEGGREQFFDKHQKVYRYKKGDILALPAGAVHWTYNDGNTPIVVVALRDTSNVANQLDRNFKKFFLAGNPQSQMQQGEPWGRPGQSQGPSWGRPGQQRPSWEQSRPGQHGQQRPSWEQTRPGQQGQQRPWWEQTHPGQQGQQRPSWEQSRPGQHGQQRPSWEQTRPSQQRQQRPSWEQSRPGQQGQQQPWWDTRPGQQWEQSRPGQQPSWEQTRPSQQRPSWEQTHRGQQGQQRPSWEHTRPSQQGQEQEGFNMFAGFDEEILQQVYDIEYDIVMQLKGLYDDRGLIVFAEDFQVLIPEEHEQYFSPRGNGIDQTICTTQFRSNIASPAIADVFNPRGGRISTLNSHKLPVLESFQLSAERGVLYKNAVLAPHYNLNAHSIMYITSGSSRLQIVRNDGSLVFDDWVQEGQLIVVPQDFAVIKKAGEEGCEWVAFKTNDNAMTTQLAGRFSYMRALPEGVLMNSYNISLEEAKSLKYSRKEGVVLSPRSGSMSPIRKAENLVLKALFG